MSQNFVDKTIEDFAEIISAEFAIEIDFGESNIAYGIFDKTFQEVDPDTGAVVLSNYPRVLIATEDLPIGFKQGSTLSVNGKTYKARTVENDGQGGTMVKLHGN